MIKIRDLVTLLGRGNNRMRSLCKEKKMDSFSKNNYFLGNKQKEKKVNVHLYQLE